MTFQIWTTNSDQKSQLNDDSNPIQSLKLSIEFMSRAKNLEVRPFEEPCYLLKNNTVLGPVSRLL